MTTMTPAQLYKFGFLLRCAEENLTPEQTDERARKALSGTQKQAGEVWNATAGLAKALLSAGMVLPIVAGAGIGVGGGMLAASAAHPEISESELRRQEILSELQKNTQRLRAIKAQHSPQPMTP